MQYPGITATQPVSVFIDPPSRHFEGDRLFDLTASGLGGGIDPFQPFVFLRDWLQSQGLSVHTADFLESSEPALEHKNVYISLGVRDRYQKLLKRPDVILSGFFAIECPGVEPNLYRDLPQLGTVFRRVFSYSSLEALTPYVHGPVTLHRFLYPQSHDRVIEDVWRRTGRQFLVMINGNKRPRVALNELYSERMRAVEFFNRTGEIDLYGVGWDGPPYHVGESRWPAILRRAGYSTQKRWESVRGPSNPLRAAALSAYRGLANPKAEVLGRYTFAICFENFVLESWITEKLFDCFYTGTVPIYWGAPDIQDLVPESCYIDMRKFQDYGELRDFLRSRRTSDIDEYRTAARDFLQSEAFHPFSKSSFASLIGGIIEKDTGLRLAELPM